MEWNGMNEWSGVEMEWKCHGSGGLDGSGSGSGARSFSFDGLLSGKGGGFKHGVKIHDFIIVIVIIGTFALRCVVFVINEVWVMNTIQFNSIQFSLVQ